MTLLILSISLDARESVRSDLTSLSVTKLESLIFRPSVSVFPACILAGLIQPELLVADGAIALNDILHENC